jgi:hypothetical protein
LIFDYAKDDLDGVDAIDFSLLEMVVRMASRFEVRIRTTRDWERAILRSFEVWRDLKSEPVAESSGFIFALAPSSFILADDTMATSIGGALLELVEGPTLCANADEHSHLCRSLRGGKGIRWAS